MGAGRTFARVAKATRIAKGISRKELAEMTRTEGRYLSVRQIIRIENDPIHDPRISEVRIIVDTLRLRRTLRVSDIIG